MLEIPSEKWQGENVGVDIVIPIVLREIIESLGISGSLGSVKVIRSLAVSRSFGNSGVVLVSAGLVSYHNDTTMFRPSNRYSRSPMATSLRLTKWSEPVSFSRATLRIQYV